MDLPVFEGPSVIMMGYQQQQKKTGALPGLLEE
jgi:hypothetical protein